MELEIISMRIFTDEHKRKMSLAHKGKKFSEEHKINIGLASKGRKHTEETKKRLAFISSQKIGDKNGNWKGDKVGYKGLHDWINNNFGKAYKCITCDKKDAKKYEWANISKEYKRDLSDWMQLCTSCHTKYDEISKNRTRDDYGRFI